MESKYEKILKELAEIEAAAQTAMQGVSDEKKTLTEEARFSFTGSTGGRVGLSADISRGVRSP